MPVSGWSDEHAAYWGAPCVCAAGPVLLQSLWTFCSSGQETLGNGGCSWLGLGPCASVLPSAQKAVGFPPSRRQHLEQPGTTGLPSMTTSPKCALIGAVSVWGQGHWLCITRSRTSLCWALRLCNCCWLMASAQSTSTGAWLPLIVRGGGGGTRGPGAGAGIQHDRGTDGRGWAAACSVGLWVQGGVGSLCSYWHWYNNSVSFLN